MIQAYSINVAVTEDSAIPFNNLAVKKGCTAELSAPATIQLNKCGVYMVSVDGTASDATTIQLYKDGIAQPQAQSTGTSVGFVSLVQVDHNNSNCCCSSPTNLQVLSDTAVTFDNVNIVVTKVC